MSSEVVERLAKLFATLADRHRNMAKAFRIAGRSDLAAYHDAQANAFDQAERYCWDAMRQ